MHLFGDFLAAEQTQNLWEGIYSSTSSMIGSSTNRLGQHGPEWDGFHYHLRNTDLGESIGLLSLASGTKGL